MLNTTQLHQRLKEINNSTMHNLHFLLESHSTEILQVIANHTADTNISHDETLETIRLEVSTVIRTLQGIETVIQHNKHIKQRSQNENN